jgi:hypothetical protein
MATSVVRCPYCVLDDNFREMVAHLDGRLICNKCGHMSHPNEPDFKCACSKCGEMRFPAGIRWTGRAS